MLSIKVYHKFSFFVFLQVEGLQIQNLVVMSEGKRPLRRPSRRLEDNIKMNLKESVCDGMD